HSSRLDDIDHNHADDDHNWLLLGATCRAIRGHYKDKVDVLVDRDGLIPGEDWNHQLNVWLAECHVAIILFSRRAIEKSNWVAKEAAILSWRRELDSKFILIPVLLDGETSPEDLAKDFFGTLKIDTSQCIRNAAAKDILAGLIQKLNPEDINVWETPLELIQGSFAHLLAGDTTEAVLEKILGDLNIKIGCEFHSDKKQHYAYLLIRHLFFQGVDHFDCFNRAIDRLIPGPPKEKVEELFRQIRSLWVDPGAAGAIPSALAHNRPLALNGKFLTLAQPDLKTDHYTLDRYIERAWSGSTAYLLISVDDTMNIDQVKMNIRSRFFNTLKCPTGISEEKMDRKIDQNFRVIVLFVQSPNADSGFFDPRLIVELQRLHGIYKKLIIILQEGESPGILPERVKAVLPRVDPEAEEEALLGEHLTRTFLNQKYGIP
ncbi:MAG: toll/interleukin-1 receptor domain-containing protein, partial [Methylococcaceae bacterium]|nr:toll/interleukin-1 receptor domain-containing protein [Methylococcaceae bacterium]